MKRRSMLFNAFLEIDCVIAIQSEHSKPSFGSLAETFAQNVEIGWSAMHVDITSTSFLQNCVSFLFPCWVAVMRTHISLTVISIHFYPPVFLFVSFVAFLSVTVLVWFRSFLVDAFETFVSLCFFRFHFISFRFV